MALYLVSPPEDEPIDLATAKRQIRREDVEDDDELIETSFIPAVSQRCQDATGRQLLTATWDLKVDQFPACGWFDVPRPPLLRVVSIAYVDGNGTTQTLVISQLSGSSWIAGADASRVIVDAPTGPRCARGRIEPAYGTFWPATRCQMNAVTVRFMAGYGPEGSSVPPRLTLAMLQDLGSMYENREDLIVGQGFVISEMPTSAAAVYRQYKSFPRQ
jgi:uncharacterized phiE125 gp8 family phage protein